LFKKINGRIHGIKRNIFFIFIYIYIIYYYYYYFFFLYHKGSSHKKKHPFSDYGKRLCLSLDPYMCPKFYPCYPRRERAREREKERERVV